MSWITIVWSMVASACLTLAAVHLVIWFKQTDQRAHLLFSVTATSVAAIGACELLLMHARSPEQFGRVVWWAHFPVFFLVVSIVWFVRLYFGAGRLWLGYTVCGLRLLALVINFFSVPNLNYKQITGLRHLTVSGGETITVAEGVGNPWHKVSDLSSLLLVVFVVDASITLWRRGNRTERHRAVLVGSGITFFILVAAGQSAFMVAGFIQSPYLISFSFLAIVAAMGYELSSDVFRAARLARQLQVSETSLREIEQQMALAASAAELAMWMWDIPRDEIWTTDKGRALFGFAQSEKINFDRFLDVVHPEDRDTVRQAVAKAVNGAGEYESEYRIVLQGEGARWIAGRGRIEFSGGKPVRMRGVSLDITRRKQAELEAARQRSELAYLSRVALLGELSGSLAHELNQPLGAIVTNAGAALRFLALDNPSREKLRETLEDIAADGRRAAEVIRGIKGIAQKKDAVRQLVSLNDVITGVIRLTRSDALAHDCAVVSELHPMLPKLEADVVQLQQVFLNLILNAFEASQEVRKAQRQIIIRTEREGDGTVLATVRDFGTGLPAQAPERVFDQFFSTKKEGMGIGLCIAQSIVSAHGGTLHAQNAKGGGAEFLLRLPAFKEVSV